MIILPEKESEPNFPAFTVSHVGLFCPIPQESCPDAQLTLWCPRLKWLGVRLFASNPQIYDTWVEFRCLYDPQTQIAVDSYWNFAIYTCLLDVQPSFSQFTMSDQSLFMSCLNSQVVGEAGLGSSSRGYGSRNAVLGKEGTKKDGGTRPHVAGRGKCGLSDLHTELEVWMRYNLMPRYSSSSPVGASERCILLFGGDTSPRRRSGLSN